MSRVDRPRQPLPTRIESTEPLPAAYRDALDRGLRDLGLVLAPAARAIIDGHARLLLSWTGSINLTAIRAPADVARLHVMDSLAGLGAVASDGVARARILDLGSGGGYPGLVLAAALPEAQVVLVDSVGKKVRFLETAIAALGVTGRVRAVAARSESLASDRLHREAFDVVVARAVGSLRELAEIGLPLVRVGGRLIAWKRGDVDAEIAEARATIAALGGGAVQVTRIQASGLDGHVVVVVAKETTTPAGYPRDPATRRRHPL